jgi:hypothetical protein
LLLSATALLAGALLAGPAMAQSEAKDPTFGIGHMTKACLAIALHETGLIDTKTLSELALKHDLKIDAQSAFGLRLDVGAGETISVIVWDNVDKVSQMLKTGGAVVPNDLLVELSLMRMQTPADPWNGIDATILARAGDDHLMQRPAGTGTKIGGGSGSIAGPQVIGRVFRTGDGSSYMS